MMRRLDEFMFVFMMFLFATGWASGWPVWHVVALVACVIFVLVRSFWPKIKEYLDAKNGTSKQAETDESEKTE